MRKSLFISSILSAISGLFPASAFAVNEKVIICPLGQFNELCNLDATKFPKFLGQIIVFFFIVAIIFALGYLIWGGIKWITSGGDKTSVETARNHIVAAIIGLIIVFLSYFILNLIVFFFTGKPLTDITLPTLTP